MDQVPKCKEHYKSIEFICKSCNNLVCAKCLSIHSKKGCKYPIYIVTYAEEELFPYYKTRLMEFDEHKIKIEENMAEFLNTLNTVKQKLHEIKAKFIITIDNIWKAIKSLNEDEERFNNMIYDTKNKIMKECGQLEDAIKNEDVGYIIKRIENKEDNEENSMNEYVENFMKSINACFDSLMNSKVIEDFNRLLEDYNSKHPSINNEPYFNDLTFLS